jgi:multidrug efflux pump subunit AcrA (membrane-fusion protein)
VKRPLYRKEALERLASPEQLDQLMQLTRPRSWLALGGLGLLLVMVLAWGFFGTIATTVEGQGVLVCRGGLRGVAAPAGGTAKLLVAAGATVAAGQDLAVLTAPGKSPVAVPSPCAARVLTLEVEPGAAVESGQRLALLEPQQEPLQAYLYVPVGQAYQVEAGMTVLVAVAPARQAEYGYLVGRVASTSRFPTAQAEMTRRLGSEELARPLAGLGPCLEIVVELTRDADMPSGYRWSSAQGWPHELHSGTPCQATVTVAEQRPVTLVVPALGKLLRP